MFGADAITRPNVGGNCHGVPALANLLVALEQLGLVNDNSTFGNVPGGAGGADGASVELRKTATAIQWRQDDDTPTWTDLVLLSEITGAQGAPGVQGPQGAPGQDGEPCDCDDLEETPGQDGDEKRCNVASFLADEILPDLAQQVLNSVDLSTDVLSLGALLVSIGSAFFTGGATVAFGAAIVAAASQLAGIDTATVNAELTNAWWSEVKCKLYCAMPDNGILTSAVLSALADEVDEIQGFVNARALVVPQIRNLSNELAAQSSTLGTLYTGNCASCDCQTENPCTEVYDSADPETRIIPPGVSVNFTGSPQWNFSRFGNGSTASTGGYTGWFQAPNETFSGGVNNGKYIAGNAGVGWDVNSNLHPVSAVVIAYETPCDIETVSFYAKTWVDGYSAGDFRDIRVVYFDALRNVLSTWQPDTPYPSTVDWVQFIAQPNVLGVSYILIEVSHFNPTPDGAALDEIRINEGS
jgi:hypothetical protein